MDKVEIIDRSGETYPGLDTIIDSGSFGLKCLSHCRHVLCNFHSSYVYFFKCVFSLACLPEGKNISDRFANKININALYEMKTREMLKK
jgi:hypothetical protein